MYVEFIIYKENFVLLGNFWLFISFLSSFSGKGRKQGKTESKVTCAYVVSFQYD